MTENDIGNWSQTISAAVGFLSAACMALYKLFSLEKDIAITNTKTEALEKTVAENKNDVDRLEEKITKSLDRIEAKLDSYIQNNNK